MMQPLMAMLQSLRALAPALLALTVVQAESVRRPNLILIMADDMGYECVGANGSATFQTPVLDRLAETGVRFEHCYSQPLCTPSRVKIMTGINNVRNYVSFGSLPRTQTTFANVLQNHGYATCIAGKWQLGREADAPQHFGFEESCLWQHTRGARDKNRRDTRYPNPQLEINGKPVDFNNGEFGPQVVTEFICDFMERHQEQPFLVYYPMILPHSPFVPTPESQDPNSINNQTNFQDMVAYIDQLVGQITAQLDALGMCENTLLLFTGDNGTGRAIKSVFNGRPFQGGKGQMTDAGTHVPLIASWPGTIAAGQVSDALVDFSDFLPTLCAAAGVTVSADLQIDGRSFLPQLTGEPRAEARDWAYCWYLSKQGVVQEWARTQRYKLYRTGSMYDISRDPLEKQPLTAMTPKATAAQALLQQALDQYSDARPAELLDLQ
jgi:arylsulfatase A